jgi:hypothetical protein
MRQRLGRWRRWVTATRARRIAFTLAVLAAMAAPFVTGSYDPDEATICRSVPPTVSERAKIIEVWSKDIETTIGCDQLAELLPPWLWDQYGHKKDQRILNCGMDRRALVGHEEPIAIAVLLHRR